MAQKNTLDEIIEEWMVTRGSDRGLEATVVYTEITLFLSSKSSSGAR